MAGWFPTLLRKTSLEAAMENRGITLVPTFVPRLLKLGALKISAGICRRNWFNEFHVIIIVKFWEIINNIPKYRKFFRHPNHRCSAIQLVSKRNQETEMKLGQTVADLFQGIVQLLHLIRLVASKFCQSKSTLEGNTCHHLLR